MTRSPWQKRGDLARRKLDAKAIARVVLLASRGVSQREIARRLKVGRTTVARALAAFEDACRVASGRKARRR